LVTAPLNKNNINSPEKRFVVIQNILLKHLEFMNSLMFLVAEDIRVGLVTGHIPLKNVAENISAESITKKLDIMNLKSLEEDFGINKPRIAVGTEPTRWRRWTSW
jgi:4-hydroxythreonine-4-phosphate dehydrogenase